jgi:predicted DNA-binding transcriptional regulator YafY
MPRNAEVIRQWEILRTIAAARVGVTINELAGQTGKTTRTVRRDLDALQQAGFALYDERMDGKAHWRLSSQPFKSFIEAGLTLPELSALYFSRTLVECLAGTPFQPDVKTAFAKLEKSLSPAMRRYLDQLPAILSAKAEPVKKRDTAEHHDMVARLVEATLNHRKAAIRYHSFSSRRIKDYEIEPYRLAYGQGGLYLFAYVPEYGQMRTFAIERIKKLSLSEERFDPGREISGVFNHSIGIHQGEPQRIKIEFAASVAPYIQERLWHPSQKMTPASDGSVVLTLNVCADWALESWILSFGPSARVLHPAALAKRILEEIEEARLKYAPRLPLEMPRAALGLGAQRRLPMPGPRAQGPS